MIQIIMLGVGIYYLFRLANLNSTAYRLGLPPELVPEWRRQRTMQYAWGMIAGWGSLIGGLVVFFVLLAATRHCVGLGIPGYDSICASDSGAAWFWMVVVTLVILVGGIVLSVMAMNKATAIERSRGMSPQAWGQLGQPWGQPGVPGQPPQPTWGQAPQPIASQAAWAQPPQPIGSQPTWGQPPQPIGSQPTWGQPPQQPGGQTGSPQPPAGPDQTVS